MSGDYCVANHDSDTVAGVDLCDIKGSPPETETVTNGPSVGGKKVSDFFGHATASARCLNFVNPADALTTDDGAKYQLGKTIAHGGMGAVIDATDVGIRRRVAMKVMLTPAASEEQRVRFIEEAQVTGQLEHPNIVPIHELGTDNDGKLYYTMKYIDGRTLQSIVDALRAGDAATIREYPLSRLLNIFLRICDGVAFAHSKGVIHRDLKLENVMIGSFGEVQIMDWGVAKIIDRAPVDTVPDGSADWCLEDVDSLRHSTGAFQTLAGRIFGTPVFMSPEQAYGRAVDERADIYSLGVMLYAILSLHTPIEEETAEQTLLRAVSGDVKHITHWNEIGQHGEHDVEQAPWAYERTVLHHCPNQQIPDSLAAVVMKAIAVDADQRYQTVQALQADIEAYQGGFATEAEDAGVLRLAQLLFERHKSMALSAVFVLAVFVALVVGFVLRLDGKEKAAQSARLEAERARDDAERAKVVAETSAAAHERLAIRSAPRFADTAARYYARQEWQEGLDTATLAVQLDPSLSAAWLQKGRGYLGQRQPGPAVDCFDRARRLLELDSEAYKEVTAYWQLAVECAKVTAGPHEPLPSPECHHLALQLQALGDATVAAKLLQDIGEAAAALMGRLEVARQELELRNGLTIPKTCIVDKRGRLGFQLHPLPITDISALAGLPITYLSLRNTKVSNLDALRGLPLRHLDLGGLPIRDLSPLKGMSLTKLDIALTRVSDISSLSGMPLHTLNIAGTAVSDLDPVCEMVALKELNISHTKVTHLAALHGKRLERLQLVGTAVADISVLADMPLQQLDLSTTPVADITCLSGMPLRVLLLNQCKNLSGVSILRDSQLLRRLNLPPDVRDIEFLRALPELRHLYYHKRNKTTAAQFWADYDASR